MKKFLFLFLFFSLKSGITVKDLWNILNGENLIFFAKDFQEIESLFSYDKKKVFNVRSNLNIEKDSFIFKFLMEKDFEWKNRKVKIYSIYKNDNRKDGSLFFIKKDNNGNIFINKIS